MVSICVEGMSSSPGRLIRGNPDRSTTLVMKRVLTALALIPVVADPSFVGASVTALSSAHDQRTDLVGCHLPDDIGLQVLPTVEAAIVGQHACKQ
jgi:hypothetical protein